MADIEKKVKVTVSDNGQLKKTTKEVDNLNRSIDKNDKANKKTSKSVQTLDRNMKGVSQMSSNASKNFSKQAQGMQGVLVPAYAEVAARVFALTAAYGALTRAADFGILLRGQELYAQQTGKNLSQIAKTLQEATGFMLDFQEASQGAALATTAGLSTSQLEDIAKVAKGASAALGRSLPDAFDRLTRGIVKGEPEILDELGLIIRLDDVYRNFAKTLGTTANELTEFQKLQARQQAVVEQQGLTKYGGIAEGIGANEFERLRASSLDLLKTLSQGAIGVFNPIAKFLSESQGALALIFALVAKNLATKIFPALAGFGEKFSKIPDNFNAKLETSRKKIQALKKLEARYDRASLDSTREMSKLQKLTGKLGLRSGSVLEQMFGISERGTLSSKQKARFIRAARQGVNAAKAAIERGEEPSGSFVGMSQKQVAAYEAQLNKVVAAQNNVVKDTSRIALGFKKAGLAVRERFTKVAIGGIKLVQGAVNGLTFAFSQLGKVINFALKAFAVVQVLSFIVDLAGGLSRTFTKATEAANNFSEATNTALESIKNTKIELDPISITGNFDKILSAAKFKTNIAQSLSDSFNAAIKQIDLEVSGLTDALAKSIDFIKSIFGQGIEDSIGEGVARGIESLSRTGFKFSDAVANQLPINQAIRDTLVNGLELTQKQVEEIEAAVTASDNRLKILKTIGQLTDANAAKQTALNAALQAGADSSKAMSDAIKDFNKSLKVTTKFDKLADSFTSAIKAIEGVDESFRTETMLKLFGGFTPALKELEDANKKIRDIELEIATNRTEGDETTASFLESRLKALKEERVEITKRAKVEADQFSGKDAALARFGFNPVEAQNKAITIEEDRVRINQQLGLIQKDNTFSIERAKNLSIELLKLDQRLLNLQLAALNYLPKEQQDEKAILNVKEQLENKTREIAVAEADNIELLKFEAELRGKELTTLEKITNEIAKQRAGGMSEDDIFSAQTQRALDQAQKTTTLAVKKTVNFFKDAMKSIAESFRDALNDSIKGFLTGEDLGSIREKLGKSFLDIGVEGISQTITDGIFSRTGVIGGFLDSVGLGGFADMIIPKTQLEVEKQNLKVQYEQLNQLRLLRGQQALAIPSIGGGTGIFDMIGKIFNGNGNVIKGGVGMYANGGVITQPTVGVVGEGKHNEAIVPLPDGRSIPVIGNTGGTNNVTVNVTVDSNGNPDTDTMSQNEQGKELGYVISQAVQEEIMLQQRPGGLLNTTGDRRY